MTLAYFADLECPYCRRFQQQIDSAFSKQQLRVRTLYVHFPLRNHKFAMPAAIASECAAEQGRFGAFVKSVYYKQDSLGLKSWSSFAYDAGAFDSTSFRTCLARGAVSERVAQGMEIGRRLGVRGTPTVIISGWLFNRPPNPTELPSIIANWAAGRGPL
ncbi:MAG: DsbA family protein [Pseudomonas sp.]